MQLQLLKSHLNTRGGSFGSEAVMEDFLTTLVVLWSGFMGIGIVIVSTYLMWEILRNIFRCEL